MTFKIYAANEQKDLNILFPELIIFSFLSICTISILLNVRLADSKFLNPNPFKILHFIKQWSCYTILLRYSKTEILCFLINKTSTLITKPHERIRSGAGYRNIPKMKRITFIIIFLLSKSAFCQTTCVVDNFSKDYFGKLFIADTTEVFSKGWVAIFDKKSKKQLIKINSEELSFELHKGKVIANIQELLYGEQSQILYQDYNFDGIKDFAIMDGHNSCYRGPSFQIFLATDKGFKHNTDFTELAQGYCGMFDIDYKTKTIRTMTKSGCCWHQYSEFKVKNNNPYPTKIVEEGMSFSQITWDIEEQNLVNGKMVKSTYQMLAFEVNKDNLLLSFEFENKKKMKIIYTENILYYVFIDANEEVELLYNDIFNYSKTENNLTFYNHNTKYVIYDDKIIVKTLNKTFEMKSASNSTKIGTFGKLKNLKLENLTM